MSSTRSRCRSTIRLRSLPNLLATPHIGYVSRGLYERFYQDTVANIAVGSTAKQRSDALQPWE